MYVQQVVDDVLGFFLNEKNAFFLVLDGASFPDVLKIIIDTDRKALYEALYEETAYEDVIEVSPYLVHVSVDNPFFIDFCANTYGNGCIAFKSSCAFSKILRHMRMNLVCRTTRGEPAFFRFYDARNLPLILQHTSMDFIDALFPQTTDFYMYSILPGYPPKFLHFLKKT